MNEEMNNLTEEKTKKKSGKDAVAILLTGGAVGWLLYKLTKALSGKNDAAVDLCPDDEEEEYPEFDDKSEEE